MTYVIAEPCVDLKDKACVEECPVDCIYEVARMLYIHPDECVVEYDRRSGRYLTPDGQLFRQSNLVAAAAPSSWEDMLPK